MKALRQSFVLEYVLWIFAGLLIWAFVKLLPSVFANPWFFTLGFFYILLLPGWLLKRFFRISLSEISGQILIIFILGLSFYFIINFLGIFAGLSLAVLVKIIFGLLILLFIITFLRDLLKKPNESPKINWQGFFKLENIYFLLPLGLGIFFIWFIFQAGPSLEGDPYLHLAIIRKALDGSSLASRALAYTKTQQLNAAYVYPAWHIFLAFLSRVFSLSLFDTWSLVIIPLTLMAILSWYWFSKIIFQKTAFTILVLVLWLIFVFYAGPGYLFTRLVIPDTFAQLILLPLGFAFALKYIFERGPNKKLLLINFLIAFMLLIMHGPHYFYLILAVGLYGILFAGLFWQKNYYRAHLVRILQVFLSEVAVLILIGLVIEFRSHALLASLAQFNKSANVGAQTTSFLNFGLLYKYGLLLLPLTLFTWRDPRKLFIGAVMLLVPLIYWTPLVNLSTKFLSLVFTERLLANTSLYFLIFAVISGGLLLVIDRILAKLSKITANLFVFLAIIIGVFLVVAEIVNHSVSDLIYEIFYSKPADALLNHHYWWFLSFTLLVTIVILASVMIKKPKLEEQAIKNHWLTFILMAILSFVLLSPSIANVALSLKKPPKPKAEKYFSQFISDEEALDFVRNHIPPKSVIYASTPASKALSTLVDQYMAYDAGTVDELSFKWLMDPTNPDDIKAEIFISPKWAIDYFYLENPVLEDEHFQAHPELYQLVYAGQTTIYKLIK